MGACSSTRLWQSESPRFYHQHPGTDNPACRYCALQPRVVCLCEGTSGEVAAGDAGVCNQCTGRGTNQRYLEMDFRPPITDDMDRKQFFVERRPLLPVLLVPWRG